MHNIPLIPALDDSVMEQAQHTQATLMKPHGILGKLETLLDLEIGLGDGSGILLAYPLIEAAMRILNEMGTSDVG